MKDLIRKFDDAKKRITKLKMYKELIQNGEIKQHILMGNRIFKHRSPDRSNLYDGTNAMSSSSIGMASLQGVKVGESPDQNENGGNPPV